MEFSDFVIFTNAFGLPVHFEIESIFQDTLAVCRQPVTKSDRGAYASGDHKSRMSVTRKEQGPMKKRVLHLSPLFTLATCFFALLCLPSVSSASPPPADSTHFCVPFDYEQWRRDHPRPAAKAAGVFA